jgi:NAD(P)-dependent dehydrogenase (short-subunit alcohol dehydrogenase family)
MLFQTVKLIAILYSSIGHRRFASDLIDKFPRLHFLINNAGLCRDIRADMGTCKDTKEGYELTLGIYLGTQTKNITRHCFAKFTLLGTFAQEQMKYRLDSDSNKPN